MESASTFQVYNASAGSGKTFTLVKEYLKILLVSEDIFTFQKVLAVTFTNKAAGEMKERVLKNLREFSEGKQNIYFQQIIEETNLNSITITKRSKIVLNVILQNYSAFYITTIDSFTYKIIKSFAFDLGLSQNFEVEMDADELLNQAVEVLVSKVGVDKELTEVLISYSLEKTDDDKSWDISRDLVEFSKILLNENDAKHFKKLTKKSLDDFKKLQKKLVQEKKEVVSRLTEIGSSAIEMIEHMNLEFNDFYRSMLPNHFLTLKTDPKNAKFFESSKLKLRIEERNFYAKSKSDDVKSAIEGVLPELLDLYNESEELYSKLLLADLMLKNIIPLSVLNHINKELEEIKEESNIRLNAEFNQLISENIQDQPAPFIYERIGQKFKHYFIDEMQDTSVFQWKNLIPLIDNSLSQEETSLLLVGDAKQAIYRWRGGKAEQFIELGKDDSLENPFQVPKKITSLDTNYRSYSEIVDFNNAFFKHCSEFIQNTDYKELFSAKTFQEKNEKNGGFVSLSFLEKKEDKEQEKLKYATKVLEMIRNLDKNFSLSDVCILVRKRKEGIEIANYLSKNNIDIVSSETLLLSSSTKVNFIIDFLHFLLRPNDKESLLNVLDFLHNHFGIQKEKHDFFQEFISLEIGAFTKALNNYGFDFRFLEFQQKPFYEKVEQIINDFKLNQTADAYVQFFLDVILEQQRKETSIQDFLDYWELKKDVLSIVSSETENAVQIMTIHKSKGLEFSVVIFPCDVDIYQELNPKIWLDKLSENEFEGFSEFMISSKKEIQYINDKTKKLYQQKRQELELDNFNLLYVALTRAQEQLYVITDIKLSKGIEKVNYYSGVFIHFLKNNGHWVENQFEYTFGSDQRISKKERVVKNNTSLNSLESNSWKEHHINLLANSSKHWGTTQKTAREYGDLIHAILAKVFYKEDIARIINDYMLNGVIDADEIKIIERLVFEIINHNALAKYFSHEYRVYNEREIVNKYGEIIIPDRLVVKNQKATIIDYKTGKASEEYYTQLNNYQKVIEELGYKIDKKILIYIHDSITIEEF